MSELRLIHWKVEEAELEIRRLEQAGFQVTHDPPRGARLLKELEADPPEAILIDLSRIPSQGRDLALAIRKRKGTRRIPIVFVAGDPAKVAKIKALLPDAVYTAWESVAVAIERAIEAGAVDVVVPESAFAAYAGKPLVEKLGIKVGSRVSLIDPPVGFEAVLGELPDAAELVIDTDADADLALWFLPSAIVLASELASIVEAAKKIPVWLAWQKGGSARAGDLTQQVVRELAMQAGLVDYKICSIDRNWSALLFTWRRSES